MDAPTVTTEATPMTMPISVSTARNLWAAMDCTAIRVASA